MNVSEINQHLRAGNLVASGLFPHLETLRQSPFVFRTDFGLEELPSEPGLLLVRGPRQYGKSTWLEGALEATVREHGPRSI